ncbi:MAG: hypothetical protein H7Z73_06775 [Candidatus Saccharibacteria bacterium]|nr:hypothetical protein [Moraxellaceae bacterium]
MKLKKLPRFKARNLLVLHPLLHKGGVHQAADVDTARMRERKREQTRLRKTNWLEGTTSL